MCRNYSEGEVVLTETVPLHSHDVCGSLEGRFRCQFDSSYSLSTRHRELVMIQRVKVNQERHDSAIFLSRTLNPSTNTTDLVLLI